ncbi:MAG TPA: MotA/TolQ/ExbB proton channel family protein [Polyangiaceae bacterium]|jgi:biopolymer transport protein ExbB|nr:MotA/TolQ/ExbB proton channel family protein [Polyangiaceae bacterium]
MNIERIQSITAYGSHWVLWVLVLASVIALGIVLERTVLLVSSRDNAQALRRDLRGLLSAQDLAGARRRLDRSPSFEASIARAGLDADGVASAEERILAEREIARLSLERHLGFLGTLGSNAPFVGLLGTVIGIVRAFHRLSESTGQVSAGLLAEIGEALVATAVGIIVALPAIVFFNLFHRTIKARLGQSDALGHEVLAYLKSDARTARSDAE